MKKFSLLFALLIGTILMSSCEKETIAPGGEETPPPLPPAQSFIMPFTGFEDADTTGFKGGNSPLDKSGPTYGNWFLAASNVVIWNTVVGLSTAIPVASFREAFNHEASYAGNGVFVWSYSYPVAGKTFTSELSGQFINNNQQIQWEMRISQAGGFQDVLWYTGIMSEDLTTATWTLNHRPENPQPFIQIDYALDPATDAFTLRYTNIIPGSPDKGDYIEYRILPTGDFNRGYDVYRVEENNLLEIQWNVPAYDGRVRNPAWYGNSDWHCWNEAQMDVDC